MTNVLKSRPSFSEPSSSAILDQHPAALVPQTSKNVRVGIHLHFRLKEINEVEGTFSLSVTGYFVKFDVSVEETASLLGKTIKDFVPIWTPEVHFLNAAASDLAPTYFTWYDGIPAQQFKSFSLIVNQHFDIRNFPFDFHLLKIQWSIRNFSERNAGFAPELLSCYWDRENMGLTSWKMTHIEFVSGKTEYNHSLTQLVLHVHRDSSATLWHVVLPIAAFNCLTFLTFAFPLGDLASRESLLITILLTFVAFQYSIGEKLPTIPYLTLLDQYSISSFCFLIFCSIVSALANFRGQPNAGNELIGLVSSLVVFIFMHLFFFVRSYRERLVTSHYPKVPVLKIKQVDGLHGLTV